MPSGALAITHHCHCMPSLLHHCCIAAASPLTALAISCHLPLFPSPLPHCHLLVHCCTPSPGLQPSPSPILAYPHPHVPSLTLVCRLPPSHQEKPPCPFLVNGSHC